MHRIFAATFILLAAPAAAHDMEKMGGMPAMHDTGAKHDDSAKPGTSTKPDASQSMPEMAPMAGMAHMHAMAMSGTLGAYPMTREASGTSWQPDTAEHRGIHFTDGDWTFMVHARLIGIYDTQSGPRGDDQFFVSGMVMAAARREFESGDTLNFRIMLSPEPFLGRRGYPLLLQTGETGDGVTPLVDRQHPHDLLMELSTSYSHRLSDDSSAFVYFGYPGEPALGPAAYMHRVSSQDIPSAPITHHWMDSTHISFGVVTAGFVDGDWKLEASQFTGREPDQFRFNFDAARFDSTSVRLSWNPDPHWSLQASWGFLKGVEQLTPSVNENRYTASATYFTPLDDAGASLAATLAFGHKQLSSGSDENGFLAETEYKPADAWTIFARAESVENAEVFPAAGLKTIGELTFGAIHDWRVAEHAKFGVGGLFTFDFVPSAPLPSYGDTPHGAMVFVRLIAD